MRVFMRVDVRHPDTRTLQPANLRRRLGLDLCFTDASQHQVADESAERWPELPALRRERRKFSGRQSREAVDQDHVTACSQRGRRHRLRRCFCEAISSCHQRRRGQRPCAVQFDDRLIDARSKSEVIRIDD